MCVLKKALMNKGLCSGKCNHHQKKNAVDVVQGVVASMKNYCDNKKNCTTACSEFGSTRCKLMMAA